MAPASDITGCEILSLIEKDIKNDYIYTEIRQSNGYYVVDRAYSVKQTGKFTQNSVNLNELKIRNNGPVVKALDSQSRSTQSFIFPSSIN